MEAKFYKALNDKKQSILSKWQAVANGSYGAQDPRHVRKTGGRFSDPIGYVTGETTAEILEWLIENESTVDINSPLEEICRLKAVQDISPDEGMSFIFALKPIIRNEIRVGHSLDNWTAELEELDKRIDEVGWRALAIYTDCRSRIHEIKMNEIKRMYGRNAG
ncbi:MAG: RsbRD N-terminal domain-containing protein [Ignavibacteriales bacterium]